MPRDVASTTASPLSAEGLESSFRPLPGSVVLSTKGTFQKVPLALLGDEVFAHRGPKASIYLRLYKDGRTSSAKVFWSHLTMLQPHSFDAFGRMVGRGH